MMTRSWTIGSGSDCDLVVNFPKVSGHHCRLSQEGDDYVLEDLGSTNGTYLDGVRIDGRVRVRPGDAITLGAATPMPWPSDASSRGRDVLASLAPTLPFRGDEMVIGRAPDCTLVLDLPMVSGHHARLSRSGDCTWIEDLGSSNGTYVNGQRVGGKVAVAAGDTISLGSHGLVLSVEIPDVLEGDPSAAIDASSISLTSPGTRVTPDPWWPGDVQGFAKFLSPAWVFAALMGQAPLVAILMTWALKSQGPELPGPEGSGVVSRAVLGALYWLGLAAIWFGLSDAVLTKVLDVTRFRFRERPAPDGAGTLGLRWFVLGLLGACQCALAWVLVAPMAGLKGPWLPVLAFLILSSVVGLALGLLIVAAVPRPRYSLALVSALVLAMGLLGGGPWPPAQMPSSVRMMAYAVPTRWTFEGLSLLVAEKAAAFPAGFEPMGVRADTMALALMAIGMTVLAGFIAHERGRGLPGSPTASAVCTPRDGP